MIRPSLFLLGAVFLFCAGCAADGPAFGAGAPEKQSEKRIAITFDDAPRGDGAFFSGPERTQRLIAALEAAGVEQAAFFVTTGRIGSDADAERLRAYADAGHVLANHSEAHGWLRDMEAADYLADIDRAEVALEGFDNRRPWFRYPFLDEGREQKKRVAVMKGLKDRGLANGYVTIDNYDWYLNHLAKERKASGACLDRDALKNLYVEIMTQAAAFYDEIALDWHGRSPAHVLLLHENDLAALYIADLIAALEEQGWRVISVDEAYEDVIAGMTPRTAFNGQGRVAAIAHALGASGRDLVHPLEDEKALDALFAERVINGCDATP